MGDYPVKHAAFVGFLVALAQRGCLLAFFPENYAFDAYQRWAGREHVLVQAWLPATQAVIAAVAAVGGGIVAARFALGVVAAFAVVSGIVLTGRLAARVGLDATAAAWAFVVAATFGPFVVWSGALYQEGTFLLVLFTGLALALGSERERRLGDLVVGGLALVRYEGWPCILLYLLWRRDKHALVALWGPLLWLVFKGVHPEVYRASPIDFDDWERLVERTSLGSWAKDVARLGRLLVLNGGLWVLVGGTIAALRARRESAVWLIAAILLSQLAATAGWIAGLEVATQRMTVVPVLIAGVLASLLISEAWGRLRKLRAVLLAGAAVFVLVAGLHAWGASASELAATRPERALLDGLPPDCTLVLSPRRGLGTRNRHDGCEIIQGVSDLRHGDGLWCTSWDAAPPPAGCTVDVRWNAGKYRSAASNPVR